MHREEEAGMEAETEGSEEKRRGRGWEGEKRARCAALLRPTRRLGWRERPSSGERQQRGDRAWW